MLSTNKPGMVFAMIQIKDVTVTDTSDGSVTAERLTCPALLKRCPARIIWKANLRTIGLRILMKQWAACSSSRALRRSESCTRK